MGSGRFTTIAIFLMLSIVPHANSEAAWWFSEENQRENSGLDLEHGYDRNTVVTQSGKIVSLDAEGKSGPILAAMKGNLETTILVLGPKDYWSASGFALKPGDDVTVKGSKAIGKDGKTYLIVQSLSITSSGNEIVLRNENGKPSWSGGNRPDRQRQMQMRQFRGGRIGR